MSGDPAPPCVFRGALRPTPSGSTLDLTRWTPAPVCWLIQRYVLRRLLSGHDHADALVDRFRFDVIGMKLVDGRRPYLVYGQALSPATDPRWMIGWVDYDRGLATDGTVQYGWGRVDSAQEYGLVAGSWVPVRQDISVPRFHASLEVLYSHFRFAPHSVRSHAAEPSPVHSTPHLSMPPGVPPIPARS